MGVICKYKYDSSMYADLIPTFNSGYSGYVITDEVEGNVITVTRPSEVKMHKSLHGLTRTLINNMIVGVTDGYSKTLEVVTISNSVLTIGSLAFNGCTNLKNIIFEGSVESWKTVSKGFNWNNGVPATKVICTDGEVNLK